MKALRPIPNWKLSGLKPIDCAWESSYRSPVWSIIKVLSPFFKTEEKEMLDTIRNIKIKEMIK